MIQKRIDYLLLLALARGPSHGHELARRIVASQPTVARLLNMFEKQGIVSHELQGKNKTYKLNGTLAARHALARAEHANAEFFLNSHPKEAALFEELCRRTSATMVILFGSYAIGTERKESDYDLYLDVSSKERDALAELHRKLRIQAGAFESSRALAQQIIRNHVILKGVDAFLTLTRPETQREAAARRPFSSGQ